jgi:hypothetical protein
MAGILSGFYGGGEILDSYSHDGGDDYGEEHGRVVRNTLALYPVRCTCQSFCITFDIDDFRFSSNEKRGLLPAFGRSGVSYAPPVLLAMPGFRFVTP